MDFKQGEFLFKQGDTDNNSFYLLEGSVELKGLTNSFIVNSASNNSNYALAQFQPRQYSALIKKNSKILSVDRNLLEILTEENGQCNLEPSDGLVVSQVHDDETGDWMTKVLQSELFNKLSASNIQKVFARIESIQVKKGDVIVNQDDVGDYFYIIEVGKAAVLRKPSEHAHPVKLNDLSVGDYFGEEALISNCRRNANVIMQTDGELMRLAKPDFIELIRNTILVHSEPKEIEDLEKEGFIWIDVRFPDECLENNEFDKLNIPLNLIRMSLEQLDPSKKYITCCEDGKKSAVAAFLLAQNGFDSSCLRGGLVNCRNLSAGGLKLDFLSAQSKKQKSSVIEFIPREMNKKEIIVNETEDFTVSKTTVEVENNNSSIDEKNESNESITDISKNDTNKSVDEEKETLELVEMEEIEEPVNKDISEETITTESTNLDEETVNHELPNEDGSEKVTSVTEEDVAEAESSIKSETESAGENDDNKTSLDNTQEVKKLLDHYRAEQENTLDDIRTKAEKRINQELSRIQNLYDEKEKEIATLKKLQDELAEKLRSENTPTLTDEVSIEEYKIEPTNVSENEIKQVNTNKSSTKKEDISDNNKQSKETSENQNEPEKTKPQVSKVLENKREILSKRHKILNDPRFRDHIRALNVKVDKEFQREIKAYKTELDEEVNELAETEATKKTIASDQQPRTVDDRPLEAKSDTTIENDIQAWIKEQESFENDPERMEMLKKKREFINRMKQDFEKNKRLNKIHDRSLISEIRSALKEKE